MMTTKEAIALLQIRVDLIKKECPDIWNDWGEGEALEMAIEALNNQFANPSKKVSAQDQDTLVNVNKGQDAYSVIGNYILNHVTAIEDMIAVIQINGVIIKELYMVDVNADGYFYWESDWWEGEEDVALLDFFPVSDAERIKWIPCSKRLSEVTDVLCCDVRGEMCIAYPYADKDSNTGYSAESDSVYMIDCIAWMPLPEPYQEERREE